MLESLFVGAVFAIFLAYFGYPVTLVLASLAWGKDVKRAQITPFVTFMITVHNEEGRIASKLLNTLGLDYPKDRIQVLVASDGSTDRTNEIVREHAAAGVELLDTVERRGKESAQADAMQRAKGEVIVFSDVATIMERSGLRQMVSNFADRTVGCVSSEDQILGRNGKPSGEGFYVQYEMWLRRLESRTCSLVGLSGSLFAARRQVCMDFSRNMQSDFRTVLNSVGQGLRGVSDPRVVGLYHDTANQRREWDRKVRTVLRGITVFLRHIEFLNVLRYRFFSYQLLCHKLLRWTVPFFLIAALGLNIVLAWNSVLFRGVLIGQTLFYGSAALGYYVKALQEITAIKIPLFFVTVNLSILVAWWRYVRGDRVTTWSPTVR